MRESIILSKMRLEPSCRYAEIVDGCLVNMTRKEQSQRDHKSIAEERLHRVSNLASGCRSSFGHEDYNLQAPGLQGVSSSSSLSNNENERVCA
jgi:hypothetical protein